MLDLSNLAKGDAAQSFLDAARAGDLPRMRTALGELAPALEPAIRRTLQRQAALVRRCRMEEDDVVQRVFERMLVAPPENPNAQAPLAVLGAWSRAVAVNFLLDRVRRIGREVGEVVDTADEPAASASQERGHIAAEQWRLARRCADTQLARHKHLRELFYAIADDPDLGARDLARVIGLVNEGDDEKTVRRGEQYVWKLRERVQRHLAEYLADHREGTLR